MTLPGPIITKASGGDAAKFNRITDAVRQAREELKG